MGEVQQIRALEEPWVDAGTAAKHFGYKTAAGLRAAARAGFIPRTAASQFGFGPRKYWRFKLSELEKAYQKQEAS
jgi:hypothetical protein